MPDDPAPIPEPTGSTDLDLSGVPAADPADVATPEAVVLAVYDTISGPAERARPRDWDRLRSLCLPDARFLIVRWPDGEGGTREILRSWDVEGFVTDGQVFYGETGFWERELWARTERFGHVAHVFSAFESRVGANEASAEIAGRGINSFQLVRRAGRWWLASTTWDVEEPDRPLPGREGG